jgi:hypothetical protein
MSTIFRGGVPTEPDVRKLMEAFGEPAPGAVIEHAAVSAAIDVPYQSSRYRTVTARWMRRLWDDCNVRVVALPGVGYQCLHPTQRLDQGAREMRRSARRARAAVKEAVTTPVAELAAPDVSRRDHLLHATAMLAQAAREASREYARSLPRPPEQMPRGGGAQ